MKYAAILSFLALRIVAADSAPAFVTDLVTGMENLDAAVRQYGGGDPRPILTAYDSLLATIKASTTAAGQLSVLPASEGQSDAENKIVQAGEDLVRDIKTTKWAFALGSICDKALTSVESLATEYNTFFTTIEAKAPADSQAKIAALSAKVNAAWVETEALLAPGSCINTSARPEGADKGADSHPAEIATPVASAPAEPTPVETKIPVVSGAPFATGEHPGASTLKPSVTGTGGVAVATGLGGNPKAVVTAGAAVKGFSVGALIVAVAAMLI